ncbi:hypothetical protein [Hymenobacter terrenus]|uniref:hypothetical protein n=1 Tax=Hymenobacter terrenus TaxID=1629124 RepID=UPI000619AE34|nr:hypothetical protein [Hymenobacter terrenus]
MAYSVKLLKTVAECDLALALANDELKTLRHQQQNIDYQRDNTTEIATEVQTELSSLSVDIASLNSLIPTLAEGPTRKRRTKELRIATNRQAELTERQELRGAVALLKRELALKQVEVQITETEAFKTEVTEHKATL